MEKLVIFKLEWRHKPAAQALEWWRQEDQEFTHPQVSNEFKTRLSCLNPCPKDRADQVYSVVQGGPVPLLSLQKMLTSESLVRIGRISFLCYPLKI